MLYQRGEFLNRKEKAGDFVDVVSYFLNAYECPHY